MSIDPNSEPIWFNEKKDLDERSIFVATPVHSEVSIHYTQSLLELQKQAIKKKIKIVFQLYKSSLVTQGRNLCVSAFLKSGFSHLLFIDSDIGFKSQSAFNLLDADKDVISVPYALKDMCWDKALYMIKNNKIKTVDDLKYKAFYRYPFKVADAKSIEVKDKAIEVTHSPTGFMMIKREVFERMARVYPDLKFKHDQHINQSHDTEFNYHETSDWNYAFFDTMIEPQTKRYLSEDYAFCRLWQNMGGKIYADIMSGMTHYGNYAFKGNVGTQFLPHNNK